MAPILPHGGLKVALSSPCYGGDNFSKPVTSPTCTPIDKSQLVVCIPKPTDLPKDWSFQDKFSIDGIQGSLDEGHFVRSNIEKKPVKSGQKQFAAEENDCEEGVGAVEHDDDFEKEDGGDKAKAMEEGFPIKDTLTGVDHEVVLDIPLRCPVQESDTSDSDTDEEASLPSLMLIESSEEVAVESTEVESPVQQLAVQTSKKVIKRSQKRQGSKRKRNVYTVYLDPEPVQAKQKSQYGPKKKRARLASKRKTKAEGKESIDALIAAFLASDAPVTCTAPVTTTHRKSRKTWRSYTNTPQDSVDSGLESGSFEGNDGTSGGGSGGSNSGDNSMSGGGSSGGGGGGGCGGGGGGKDGDSQKDQEPIIISDGETSEDEEQTSDEEMAQDTDKQVPQFIDFDITELQHASYCKPGKQCRNTLKCHKIKEILTHWEAHHDARMCSCCAKTYQVITAHAEMCCLPSCGVPYCSDIREGKTPPAPVRPPRSPLRPVQYHTPVGGASTASGSVDGKIIFRAEDADFMFGSDLFQEHVDYHVMKGSGNNLGSGSRGEVLKIITEQRLQLALKRTNQAISAEELKVYQALGSHENLVKVYGVTFHGVHYRANIFMQEQACSVFDFMDQRCLDISSAMYLWCQVLDAVAFLHNRVVPIVHKDIKAKNVLLCHEFTRAVLADFDAARLLPDEVTKGGLDPQGTQGFAAPEVLRKQPHGTPADIYSLGCFLLEMIVGIPYDLPQKLRELWEMDAELAQLICACVDPDPQNRPTAMQIKQCPVVRRYQANRTSSG